MRRKERGEREGRQGRGERGKGRRGEGKGEEGRGERGEGGGGEERRTGEGRGTVDFVRAIAPHKVSHSYYESDKR